MRIKVDDKRLEILKDKSRFLILVAGRRWGKTWLSLSWLLQGEIQPNEHRFFVAPTYRQGKLIAWNVLKQILSDAGNIQFNETELRAQLPNHSQIRIVGADRSDSLRGVGLKRVVLDEFAYMKPDVWQTVILPMLSSTNGRALFAGTPSGYNHFHKVFIKALDDPQWSVYQYKTIDGGNVPKAEIETAQKEMDERTYKQEFEATFESYEGNLYYNFDTTKQIKNAIKENIEYPIWLTCDFNKAPMIWLVCQQIGKELVVLEELCIKYNAKTQMLIAQFVKKYKSFNRRVVYLTGDASNKYESHRDFSTDYVIIKDILESAGWTVVMRVPKKNPSINNRINVVCGLFQQNKIKITDQANYLIQDLKANESDGKGAKSKLDPNQTHASDAFDYITWILYANEFYKSKTSKQQTHQFMGG